MLVVANLTISPFFLLKVFEFILVQDIYNQFWSSANCRVDIKMIKLLRGELVKQKVFSGSSSIFNT